MRRIIIFLAVVSWGCRNPVPPRLGNIDAIVDPYIRDEKIAGFVGLILHDGKPIYDRATGWSDREAKKPMQADTIFRIASLTKAVTTAAALMLIEEGKLSPNEPVAKYIPSFASIMVRERDKTFPQDPVTKRYKMKMLWPYRPITVQHLLAQTSGLSYGTHPEVSGYFPSAVLGTGGLPRWYLAASSDPICRTADKLGRTVLSAQPGSVWVYGYNTDVLGCIIEMVSGMRLDEFFRTRITEKLGMKDTHFYLPEEKRGRLAVLYGSSESGKVERSSHQGAYVDGPRVNFSGGAGLLSTAADYALFIEMIRNGGELDGVRLLKPESVKLMTTNQVGETYGGGKGNGFGYGFEVVDRTAGPGYGELSYGWFGAYGPYLRVFPREKIVMILMSQLYPNGADMREKLIAEMQTMVAAKQLNMPMVQRQ